MRALVGLLYCARCYIQWNFYILEHLSTWIVITILLAFCIELLKTPIRDKMVAPFRNTLEPAETSNKKEKKIS